MSGGPPPPPPPLTSGRSSWRVRLATRRPDACGIKAAGKGRAEKWQEPGGVSELPMGWQERGSAECREATETPRDRERSQRPEDRQRPRLGRRDREAGETPSQRCRDNLKTATDNREPRAEVAKIPGKTVKDTEIDAKRKTDIERP